MQNMTLQVTSPNRMLVVRYPNHQMILPTPERSVLLSQAKSTGRHTASRTTLGPGDSTGRLIGCKRPRLWIIVSGLGRLTRPGKSQLVYPGQNPGCRSRAVDGAD